VLRVSPGAARNEVVGRYGEGWKVRVTARAERGRANRELLGFLAATLGVHPARLRLTVGQGARDKVVEIDGMTLTDAERLLSAGRRKGNV
jgi:uncharacterized protein (TIGR00251 family)